MISPDRPFSPARFPIYYGWVILVVATLGLLMSIPGQTTGVSVFTDPLLEATGVGRLGLANTYLVGTLASGFLLPFGGRLVDRFGARRVGLAVCWLLAGTLVFLSQIDRVGQALGGSFVAFAVLLSLGFMCLRFSAQGMLTLVSWTMIGRWFARRRGLVSGISGVFMAFGSSAAPLGLSILIEGATWRGAWLWLALVAAVGMAAIAYVFYRDTPESCGLVLDGVRPEGSALPPAEHTMTRGEALRTGAFWAVTLALSTHSLVVTGITFHIVDLGAADGLTRGEAVAMFLPMAVASTSTGLLVGWIGDRVRIRWLLVTMMVVEAIGMLCFSQLGVAWTRWLGIATLGFAGGFFGPLTTLALPRYFGRRHLGAISGAHMMCLVVGSGVGPSLLAASATATGRYDLALYLALVLPASAALLALVAREPHRAVSS